MVLRAAVLQSVLTERVVVASTPTPSKGSTGKFFKQGQTAGSFGNDPSVGTKNGASTTARDLKG